MIIAFSAWAKKLSQAEAQALYQHQCMSCHGAPPTVRKMNVAKVKSMPIKGKESEDETSIIGIILRGLSKTDKSGRKNRLMPAYTGILDKEKAQAIAKYLKENL